MTRRRDSAANPLARQLIEIKTLRAPAFSAPICLTFRTCGFGVPPPKAATRAGRRGAGVGGRSLNVNSLTAGLEMARREQTDSPIADLEAVDDKTRSK